MTHCAKCGAELIGTRKFCTACGAPAGDPRSPAASTGMSPAVPPASAPGSAPGSPRNPQVGSSPSIQYAPSPASAVNPFAQTAGPKNMPVLDNPQPPMISPVRAPDYGPPPSVPLELASTTKGVGDPHQGPQVSPLAVSNVDSNRGGMVDAMVASARTKRDIPGTQLMPSMANPPVASAPAASAPAASAAKKADRTQLLGAIPRPASAPRVPTAPIAPTPASVRPAAIAPAAASGGYPAGTPEPSHADASGPYASQQVSHGSQPGVQLPRAPSYPDPSSSQPGVPLPQGMYPQAPAAPQGWNPAAYPAAPYPAPPATPPAPPAYGYGYPPGTRVNVTWSNGQRYPGTVQQIAGNQCLVVFPDGQHHWVDLQYVGPG